MTGEAGLVTMAGGGDVGPRGSSVNAGCGAPGGATWQCREGWVGV